MKKYQTSLDLKDDEFLKIKIDGQTLTLEIWILIEYKSRSDKTVQLYKKYWQEFTNLACLVNRHTVSSKREYLEREISLLIYGYWGYIRDKGKR